MSLREERAALLDRTAWVRGMSWEQVCTLADYMTPTSADAGAQLVAEGARDASACVILEGEAVVSKRDSDSVERMGQLVEVLPVREEWGPTRPHGPAGPRVPE